MSIYVQDPIAELPASSYEDTDSQSTGAKNRSLCRSPFWEPKMWAFLRGWPLRPGHSPIFLRASSVSGARFRLCQGQQVEVDPNDLSRRLSQVGQNST